MSDDTNLNLNDELRARFSSLPKVVQNAITSSDVQNNLRALANTYKLHLDQWDTLENTVILGLLGFVPIADLAYHISTKVGMPREKAEELAGTISKIVFEPIRQELERQLEHPEAQTKQVSAIEAARNQTLGTRDEGRGMEAQEISTQTVPAAPQIAPATPPSPVPDIKVTRPSESTAYKPGETSAQRATVHDDPYREPPL